MKTTDPNCRKKSDGDHWICDDCQTMWSKSDEDQGECDPAAWPEPDATDDDQEE